MPQPEVNDLHVDKLLTEISIATLNEPGDYVATDVFPRLEVRKQSDLIPKYDEYAWLSDEAKPRAPAAESEGSGWTVDNTMRYYCENYSFHKDVPVEAVANADSPYNLDEEAAMFVVDRMLMRLEVKFAADFFVTGKWTGESTLTGANQWSDTTSKLFKNIEDAKIAVGDRIVKEPKVMIIGRAVWSSIIQHPNFLDRMKTTSDKIPTIALAQQLFDIPKILIARALKATNKEGQTIAKARVLGKNALLLYVTPRASLLSPTAGYTFFWPALGPGYPVYTRRINMPLKLADRIEGHVYYDQKITSADAGYLYINAVA